MLHSMTGYGSGQAESGGLLVRVDVRTVNHRYLDVVVRLPRAALHLETLIRTRIQSRLSRGRVEVYVSLQDTSPRARTVRVDEGLLRGYWHALERARQVVPVSGSLDAGVVCSLPDVFVVEESEPEEQSLQRGVLEALDRAVDAVVEMRRREGAELAAALYARHARLAGLVEEIAALAPMHVQRYRERLQEKLAGWEPLHGQVLDAQRLALEVALLAERSDISEEVERIRSHLKQFEELLACGEGAQGRRLDFLAQELQREFNTIASKSQDYAVSERVVEAKTELERIREQVQNVE